VVLPPAIVNTTISGNYGTNGGGLLYEDVGCSFGASFSGPIVNTTITNNHATLGGGIYIASFAPTCTASVVGPSFSNSIVAGNSATEQGPDCLTEPNAPPPCSATSQAPSDGYNLIGDATSCNFIATTGDQVGTESNPINPGLGPLANNGGPTMTHALLPLISPAVDAGSPDVPGSINTACEPTDQRGIARPQDGDLDGDPAVCDIGAFELVPRTDVAIEVEPFLPKDPIILSSRLPVVVAILGSRTVDVTKIDPTTLQLGPNGATPLFTHTVPANGQLDLVALFRVQDTGLAVGDSQACLRAAIGGQPFLACDDVVVIMGRGCGLGFELVAILLPLLWLRGRRRRRLT
jgi:hypothetical protein